MKAVCGPGRTKLDPLCNKVLSTTVFFAPVKVKYMKKKPNIVKPYRKHILPVSSPLVLSRFHCVNVLIIKLLKGKINPPKNIEKLFVNSYIPPFSRVVPTYK